MTSEEFDKVVDQQLTRCKDILCVKAKEYATNDRLHNFKVAAEVQCTTSQNALAGMMAKHTISVYDMCRSGKTYPMELWDEKITDHINYLILLKALMQEKADIAAEHYGVYSDNRLYEEYGYSDMSPCTSAVTNTEKILKNEIIRDNMVNGGSK